jgi:hypothetical protein
MNKYPVPSISRPLFLIRVRLERRLERARRPYGREHAHSGGGAPPPPTIDRAGNGSATIASDRPARSIDVPYVLLAELHYEASGSTFDVYVGATEQLSNYGNDSSFGYDEEISIIKDSYGIIGDNHGWNSGVLLRSEVWLRPVFI